MIGTWKFRPSAEKALGSAGDGQRQVSLGQVSNIFEYTYFKAEKSPIWKRANWPCNRAKMTNSQDALTRQN